MGFSVSAMPVTNVVVVVIFDEADGHGGRDLDYVRKLTDVEYILWVLEGRWTCHLLRLWHLLL